MPAKKKEEIITVKTKGVDRRCRAGLCFDKEPTELKVDDLKEGQLEALKADVYLIIE